MLPSGGDCSRSRCLWLLGALLAVIAGAPEPGSQAALDVSMLESLPPEQLVQFLSVELMTEDRRPREPQYSFDEFQQVAEMDCSSRLFYLMNLTVNVRDAIRSYHSEVIGLAGVFVQLLRRVPDENSWLWLMATSQERGVQKVQTYFARVMALSVDQHHCLKAVVRDALLSGVQRWKDLHVELMASTWYGLAFGVNADPAMLSQSAGPGSAAISTEESLMAGNVWLANVRNWFDSYAQELYEALLTLESQEQELGEAGPVRLHHQDEHGSFVTYEFLRRKVFGQWAIDRGLVRGLLRYVWQPAQGEAEPLSVGDFGAGGGHYSRWLNETGLVTAFAFDGTHQAAELTDGVVQEVNLVQEMRLWRTFDWVLCLEVGEHVPKQYADTLLGNLKSHAQKGLVMSWSDDWEGIGHVNCLSREQFVAMVQEKTGFMLDAEATEVVRQNCEIDYIARTLAVFRARS
eukprot:TRINITY_DN49165_c0_g1_i1.p1 TRINITY_DN49165_c0_g1~~TRINITY_DN49165_c0_g1_i1.p1  ORF type:complete len:460 (-),score=94.80 TRINITY_DN49165_c0_g1_i1:61-1440(-)